jgi:hypothetical protein
MNPSVFRPKQLVENSVEKTPAAALPPACPHPPKMRLALRCEQLVLCFQSLTKATRRDLD